MINMCIYLQPTLRVLCESLHTAGNSTPCRWITTAKTLGVQMSEKQLKQQCAHLFPVDSCAPLVSIKSDQTCLLYSVYMMYYVGKRNIQLPVPAQ